MAAKKAAHFNAQLSPFYYLGIMFFHTYEWLFGALERYLNFEAEKGHNTYPFGCEMRMLSNYNNNIFSIETSAKFSTSILKNQNLICFE